jgi:hypothetical protein
VGRATSRVTRGAVNQDGECDGLTFERRLSKCTELRVRDEWSVKADECGNTLDLFVNINSRSLSLFFFFLIYPQRSNSEFKK